MEWRSGYGFGPEARDALDDGTSSSHVSLLPLLVPPPESSAGPVVFLMPRAHLRLQGCQ